MFSPKRRVTQLGHAHDAIMLTELGRVFPRPDVDSVAGAREGLHARGDTVHTRRRSDHFAFAAQGTLFLTSLV